MLRAPPSGERDRFAGASTAEFHGSEDCEGLVSSYASAVLAISRSPAGKPSTREDVCPLPRPCQGNGTRDLLEQLESWPMVIEEFLFRMEKGEFDLVYCF